MAEDQTTGRPLSDRETKDLVGKIQSVLTPDLLEPKYRKQSEGQHPTFGHCASAIQAAYYMLGGKESGYVPQVAKEDDGTTHWWLKHRETGHVIDPTKEQYTSQGEKPPYDLGRGCGFPNPNPDVPSKRGQEIIDRISGKPFRQAKASGGPVEDQDIASPAPAEDEGIDVYHSSPHKFDSFDISKIGTGEGRQTYGHGLYLAENPEVAQDYKSKFQLPDEPIDYTKLQISMPQDVTPQQAMFIKNALTYGDEAEAIRVLSSDRHLLRGEDLRDIDLAIDALKNKRVGVNWIGGPPIRKRAHMYEVRIKAHPDHFLDWDKPLSEQSEFVRKALNDFVKREKLYMERYPNSPLGNPFGSNIYESDILVPGKYRDRRAASKALLDRGIVGIRYLDAGSRDKGAGTSNYVVFDDKLLDIKRRYETGGAVPMASGGETGDNSPMPMTPDQQRMLDDLSAALDRSLQRYRSADENPAANFHPHKAEMKRVLPPSDSTMHGETPLSREQDLEFHINRLQNASVPYAEGGGVDDNPAVQKALSLTAAQNRPVLYSTFALENRPSAIVSPRPGKGGGPPIIHPQENFDPSLVTEQNPWTYATPDIIGAPKPPPVQHPVLNEPRMKNISRRTAKIFNDKNFHALVKDLTGLEGVTATPTVGTWQSEMEPSFIINHPNMTSENAKILAHLLGFGFQQDAAVHTVHNDSIESGIPALLIGNGKKLTPKDIDKIAKHSKGHGLDFTITADGKAAKYLHFGDDHEFDDFSGKVSSIADASGMNEKYHGKTQGDLINAKEYLDGIFGSGGGEARIQTGSQKSPNLFRRIVDHVLAPYAQAVASEGYRLSPERLKEAYGLTDDESDYVRTAMLPSGRADRTTIPLMTGKEKLDIRPTGSRGNPTVEDVLWALQNRAASKGQIDPGDYSKEAMNKIASDIAKEVDYHVKSSGLGGQKSAIGWYDDALKKAMSVYSGIFPQLEKNKDDRMLFHAILGITSQGNDVYSNSLNAVRVFDLMKNKGLSLSDAVKKLSGTFGDKTKAIEMNLLKFDHLVSKNGYDAMRQFFNTKASASEINKILRTNKNLHGLSGPLDVEGQKDQIVSGWSVFGPKIGSFINNLHGDYSTLTADLWFSRTWNRLLGHGFIHTPLAEAKQYRDLRDAMIAEYSHHHGLPYEQAPYVQNGKINEDKSWLHGSDLKDISHDDFYDLINDPDKMLEFAKNAHQNYKDSAFKEKSDVRRRAKNWIENRELPVAAPRSDLERFFQQSTAEQAQRILKKKYNTNISVADIQAALWFHEKELFDRLGVASKKSKPADYADAARETMNLINGNRLYEVKSREKKGKKSSGGSVVDQALRLVSKYGSLPGDAVSLSRHLIQRGRP